MSQNIHQVYVANPITSNAGTDLMYFGQSPYGAGNDAAMTFTNFSAQFTSSTLTSTHIYVGNGSNVATSVAVSGDVSLANTGAMTVSKIGGVSISLAGSFTTSGAFSVTQTYTGTTNLTFPTSGTLATTAQAFIWNDVSGTSQAAVGNNGYIISNAAQTTVTIPATIAEGQVIGIAGKGAGGWILQANTGQTIHYGSSATSSAGSLTSTNQWDSVQIVCVTANTTFSVIASQGNLTVA